MVALLEIAPELLQKVADDLGPLLPRLHDFTEIQVEPKILCLRNPDLHPEMYKTWQKDHRYGRRTCPAPSDPCWPASVSKVAQLLLQGQSDLTCMSAMVIHYSSSQSSASYHKDPPAYARIASLTLMGL